jgi:hypothetical protein
MRADAGGEDFGNITFVDSAGIDFATSAGSNGDLYINSSTDGTVGGNLSVTATTGNITDTVAVVTTGSSTSSFTTSATNGTIDLSTPASLAGAVTINTTGASGHATIDNGTTALIIAASSIGGNLTVTSGAAAGITDTGTVTVGGNLVATTDLNNGVIDLGQLAVTGTMDLTSHGSGNVTIDNDTSDIVLIASGIGGNLTLTSGAAAGITDTDTVTVAGNLVATTDANNGVIDLGTTTVTGTMDLTSHGSGNVTIDNDTSDIVLIASEIGGNLTVTSGAAAGITDTGTVTVAGNLVATTDLNNGVINLDTMAIDGTVALTTNGSGNATFDNGTLNLDLAASNVGGNLTVIAGDSITDSGVITVSGTASFTTDTSDKLITLNEQNAITGQVTFDTTSTGGDVVFDNGITAINLGVVSGGDIGGDLTLLTDADQTISNAITLAGSGADLSITVDANGDNTKSLTVQAALTTNAGGITLSADDDIIFTAVTLTSANGNISVTADDDATSDAESGGALTMADGTIFSAGSGTITGIADEDITLGQMTTTNSTSSAITLNTTSGNILDGGDAQEDLTAASGTVVVTTGGSFGTKANAIEITSAVFNDTGVSDPVKVLTTAEGTLEGSNETVGEASVDQTINIVENLIGTVEQGNQIVAGNSSSTVSAGVNTNLPGTDPFIVDVYSESYELVKTEAGDTQIAPAIKQLNDLWMDEEDN